MSIVRIGVLGAAGRMGRAVIEAASGDRSPVVLGAALERAGAPELGRDASVVAGLAPRGVMIGCDLDAAASAFDVLVDFTRPDGTLAAVEACLRHGKGMVIGTTGFDVLQQARIDAAARTLPIVKAGNFSIGVNVCLHLLEHAARALGPGFDVEIVEAHHRHKVDAPSGTALMMGEAVARGAGTPADAGVIHGRHGHTGPRPAGAIGYSSIRGGDVVGDHVALFLGEGERIEIAHRASSRVNFAGGAVRAAAWVATRGAGLYAMRDVLSA